ncbi:hypothetical protein HIM_08812 [Hirsutella minnesotensis 3608]|uniref:Gfd2/YDR514C-like C-terminal domain-containing protein n=1 Tax=Hirsutella minnesotensis 3608 TaxID=1043627 RepID=A0A0F7ZY37_9HYPO|nr:hypothetical protein HIM_08812 [Hirsutella minnesotensis 3608]
MQRGILEEDDFARQLDMLQQLLGKKVSLREANSHEEAPAPSRDNEAWENRQARDSPTFTISCPSASIIPDPKLFGEQEAKVSVAANFSSLGAGEPAGGDFPFCPWKAIQAYPNMFIGKTNKPLARPFFNTILEDHEWDFFYLHDPQKPNEPPHLLVPTEQFEDFLCSVNNELGIALTIPPGINRKKFCILFSDQSVPQPRYLMHSADENSLRRSILPKISKVDVQKFDEATKAQRDVFIQSVSRLARSTESTDKKEKAQERARLKDVDRKKMMERTQSFLGLTEPASSAAPVFIGMDLEALELAPHCVSEVGIAILDADKVQGVSPGTCGSNWWPFIKAHHLRTQEYSGSINRRFVQGCPDAFNFGESTFPPKHELVKNIRAIVEPYVRQQRNLIFVAHDPRQDLKFLSYIGLDIERLPGISGEIDTQALHQVWCDGGPPRSLSSVLSDLGMRSENLHNAGNDAVYTVRAMTALAVEQSRKDDAARRGEAYRLEYTAEFESSWE